MASTFSNLGIILQASGENSGTWGDRTNVNLQRIDNAITGISNIVVTGATTLAFSTNSDTTTYTTEAGRSKILVFTGTPGTPTTITLPNVEKEYLINNKTDSSLVFTAGTGASTYTVTTNKINYVYVDGSDEVISAVADTPPGGSNTQIQFNSSGSFGGSANLVWDGTNVTLGATGALRLGDTTGGEYVGLKAPGTVSSSYTLTLPTATGTADQILVTDGSGNLSFTDNSGGTSWQAVKTTGFTAVAGEGYFCDTSSAAFTATLPATPTLGDEVTFVDYAGTFDTNNLTVGRNGENIQGSAADLTVSVERAGLTLVYSGATQGWLLKDK